MTLKPTAPRAVLFDLDDTLFDHNYATQCATARLRECEPAFQVWSGEELRRRHSEVLELVHQEVIAGRLTIENARRVRFERLLRDCGCNDAAIGRASEVAGRYRTAYEQHWRPVRGALELLTALRSRGITIGIVTNNLTAEQRMKLQRCELETYIDLLMTSEDAGVAKPQPGIFHLALEALGVRETDAVMVGDAWDTDIAGAIAAGVRPVWFNWRELPAREIAVDQIASLTPLEAALDIIAGLRTPVR